MVEYVKDKFPEATYLAKPVPRRGSSWNRMAPGQGADGYGTKISTDYMVVIDKIKYRVYACCVSNVASHYILVKKEAYYIDDFDISEKVKKEARTLSTN